MYQPVKLPYAYKALEPIIDEKTMYVHYNEHYLGYLKKLNDLIDSRKPIVQVIGNIDNYSDAVRDNAGGYYNHSIFWKMLKPYDRISKNEPPSLVKNVINRDFGSYTNFKNEIRDKAKKRFGSGWVWWILQPNGRTAIVETPYQDNPLMYMDCEILLGIDVWEHAYYLKYQAKRDSYVNNIFQVINWNYPYRILINK